MSQHDLTIDNQGFPAFRADLNNALQALGSTQSGTTAPSPTFANQLWYDTTNNQLKIRNEDNDAWIVIVTLNQSTDVTTGIGSKTLPTGDLVGTTDTQTLSNKTVTFADGSAATPAISPASDSNTGIFFPAADTIGFAEGGAEAMRIDSSGNVGIGASSPNNKLDIIAGSLPSMQIQSNKTNSTAKYSLISSGHYTSTTYPVGFSMIGAEGLGSVNNVYIGGYFGEATASTNVTFYTATNNTTTGGSERMRIDSSGNVGIRSSGGTSPTYDYSTLGEGLWLRYWDNSGTRTADIVATGNTPAGATQIMRFLTNTGSSPASAVERGRFDASGNFQFNSGYGSVATAYGCRAWVNFNGTGTPAIRASGNVSSITDNGTGDYSVNFTTSMPDANYGVAATSTIRAGVSNAGCVIGTRNTGGTSPDQTASAVRLITIGVSSDAEADSLEVKVAIFR